MRKQNQLPGSRKGWAFSQQELATLTGVGRSVISRYERGDLTPSARTLMALEVIFGHCGRKLFPFLHHEIEEAVMRRAAKLDEALRHATDPVSRRKLSLLSAMVKRGISAEPA